MALSSEPMGKLLLDVHNSVRAALATHHDVDGIELGVNPKGDVSQQFDLIAERSVERYLRRHARSAVLLSEESGELILSEAPHEWCFILDPVDGSDNYARGLNLSGVCLAVLPAGAPLAVGNIEWALVGELERATPLLVRRGGNAFRGDVQARTSAVERIQDAFVSVELNHFAPPPALGALMQRARGVRSLGCASRALALVATGALDAHVDVRNRLTAESFFAAALAVEEAGGCVLNSDGRPLPFARDLTQRFSLIAAATRQLADAIVEALR
jgi:myo-inositol-1(or 4)-monophosphatase